MAVRFLFPLWLFWVPFLLGETKILVNQQTIASTKDKSFAFLSPKLASSLVDEPESVCLSQTGAPTGSRLAQSGPKRVAQKDGQKVDLRKVGQLVGELGPNEQSLCTKARLCK